tara:strand:- start:238 stop:660 length:423 start_codon:yes stop_codon:yes gene_type:complete
MLTLTRFALFDDRTLGRLTYGNEVFYTVEKPWKDNEPFVSCIPAGSYTITKGDSPRFGPNTWQVMDVPGRTHILFHVGNTADDVVGCIAVGTSVYGNLEGVGRSKPAMARFDAALRSFDAEKLEIKEDAFYAFTREHEQA